MAKINTNHNTKQQANAAPLLSPTLIQQLDRLDLVSRKMLSGKLIGERHSKKKGQSVEFADYRQYVVGDDLRFIDWNLYARLDRLFIRLFMEEQDLSVSIVFDVSASMDFGEPNKLHYAKQLAAMLGYVGLVHYNRVSLYSVTNQVSDYLGNLRGRQPVPQMIEFLTRQHAESKGDLATACKNFSMMQRQKGIVILISDFMDKGDLNDAFRFLAGDRYDVYAIQLLSPQEVDPTKAGIVGDLRLRDVEDDQQIEVSVTRDLLNRYKATVAAYCQHVRKACLKRGIAYLAGQTDVDCDVLVLKYIRERGLLR